VYHVSDGVKLSSVQSVDIVERVVYEYLKPFGFRKHGRTLHRFVDGDISQVIHLQNGCPEKSVYGVLWVNLGIRVPECVERSFIVLQALKKYYHEYECNIRTRLGYLVDSEDTFYSLDNDPAEIGNDIVERLKEHATPVFDVLNSRDAILEHRKEFPRFDSMCNHLVLLEEAMILGRKGDLAQASCSFNKYYRKILKDCNNKAHIEYVEKLSEKLGITLDGHL